MNLIRSRKTMLPAAAFVLFLSLSSQAIGKMQEPDAQKLQTQSDRTAESSEIKNHVATYDEIIQINRLLANSKWNEAETLINLAASRTWPEPFDDLLKDHILAYLALQPARIDDFKNRYSKWNLTEPLAAQARQAATRLGLLQAEKAIPKTADPTDQPATLQTEDTQKRDPRFRNKKSAGQDLRRLIHLWTSSKEKNAKEEAYSLASTAKQRTSREEFLGRCNAFWAYSQFVLGRKARADQNRKIFFERQMLFTEQLQNKYCDAAHFFMSEDQFQQFKQSELLWAARLLWENNYLDTSSAASAGYKVGGAEQIAREVLQQALEAKDVALVLEAAQVLYGRILFEADSPKLVAAEIALLIEKIASDERSSGKQLNGDDLNQTKGELDRNHIELISYLKFRLALFHYAAAEDGKCSNALKPEIERLQASQELYESPSVRKDYVALLYWRARCEYLQNTHLDKGNKADQLKFAFNEINKYSATSYYAMVFDLDFPWVRNAYIPKHADFLVQPEALDDKNNKTVKKLENFREVIQSSKLFLETDARSPLSTFPLKWLNNQLKNNEKQVFLYSKELLFDLHKILQSKEFNSELILSAGRLARHFRLDLPQGHSILQLLYPTVYPTAFKEASIACKVDIPLLYAVSRQESLFEPQAQSPAGARGLLQLMPAVWQDLRKERSDLKLAEDPFHVGSNLLAGACHLHDAISYFRGNLLFALAGYNAGTANVRSWIERRFKGDERLFTEFIPFAETQDYVKQILRSRHFIQKLQNN